MLHSHCPGLAPCPLEEEGPGNLGTHSPDCTWILVPRFSPGREFLVRGLPWSLSRSSAPLNLLSPGSPDGPGPGCWVGSLPDQGIPCPLHISPRQSRTRNLTSMTSPFTGHSCVDGGNHFHQQGVTTERRGPASDYVTSAAPEEGELLTSGCWLLFPAWVAEDRLPRHVRWDHILSYPASVFPICPHLIKSRN